MLLNKQVTITTGGVKEKVHLCIREFFFNKMTINLVKKSLFIGKI